MPGPNTFLTLAGYTFKELEVPQNIKIGGSLVAKIHQLPGGVRRVDSMSASDDNIEWEGLFFGADASDTARLLDSYRKSGQAVDLDWWDLSYSVLIERFEITFERYFQVAYKISCIVVQDNCQPPLPGGQENVDDLVGNDAVSCYGAAEMLGMTIPGLLPGPVASSLGVFPASLAVVFAAEDFGIDLTGVALGLTAMRGALNTTPSFSGVSSANLATTRAAIAETLLAVTASVDTIETDMAAAPGFAGMVSGQDDPTVFQEFMAEAGQETQLLAIGDYLARMNFNASAGTI